MKRQTVILGFLVLLLTSGSAWCAEAPEGRGLELEPLLNEARERNPAIMAAREQWQGAGEMVAVRRALPDPQLSYSYLLENVETRVGPQRHVLGIKQKFPFYGKRDLRAEAAAKEAEAAQAAYEAVRQEVIRRVKNAFYDLFYTWKIIDITLAEKAVLKRFEQIALTKYATGKGGQQNILKVQVELSKLEDRLLELADLRQRTEAVLNALLDRPAEQPLERPSEPRMRAFYYLQDQLFRLAEAHRPELKQTAAWIGKSEQIYRLAQKEYYPDVTVGATYIEVGEGPLPVSDNGQDAFNVMFSINLPIWREKLASGLRGAARLREASRRRREDVRNRVLAEVKDTYFRIQTARETVSLYRNVLVPQAEQSLRSAEAGYITGEASFLDLLDAERILLKIQTGYWRAYTDYLKRIADMERAAGTELVEFPPEPGAPEVEEE